MSRNVDGNRDLTEIFLDGNVDCHKQFAESDSQTSAVSANLGWQPLSLSCGLGPGDQLTGPGPILPATRPAHLHWGSVEFWPQERADVTVSSPG